MLAVFYDELCTGFSLAYLIENIGRIAASWCSGRHGGRHSLGLHRVSVEKAQNRTDQGLLSEMTSTPGL